MQGKNQQIVLLSSDPIQDKKVLDILNLFNINPRITKNLEQIHLLFPLNKIHLLLGYDAYCRMIQGKDEMMKMFSSVFIYGTGVVGVLQTSMVRISDHHRDVCKEFSGLSFVPGKIDVGWFAKEENPMDVFVSTLEGFPLFYRRKIGNCEQYFLSVDVQDVNMKVDGMFIVNNYFLGLVPVLMYLKKIDPDCIGGTKKYACVIVDDPYLRMGYGYFNYNSFMNLMEEHNFTTTIAYIPWNYRIRDKNVISLLLRNKDKMSICVHGCNHTKHEYMSTDLSLLNKLTNLATSRMLDQEKNTGLPFDRVMVFPQGKFSNQAIDSIRENNYMAAINTSPLSSNIEESMELKDYIGKYIAKYGGFPLFTRNTPDDAIGISFNLFVGKPAFIVIHHGYLKDGCRRFIAAIESVNSRAPGIRWATVGEISRDLLEGVGNVNGRLSFSGTAEFYGNMEKISVYTRRKLCNFRDNYLSKINGMTLAYDYVSEKIKG